jgi:pimeloyl-ACP methyl ester carboxylesterase
MPFLDILQKKRLHYADSHPHGTPVGGLAMVFIHGLGSSQNYYFPILPHLIKKHRCITIDTYGSGRSTYGGLAQTIETIAEDVLAVMDALDIKKAAIIGHSMGGTTATYIAAQFPERVNCVVAIGPVHPTPNVANVFEKRIQIVSEGKQPRTDPERPV